MPRRKNVDNPSKGGKGQQDGRIKYLVTPRHMTADELLRAGLGNHIRCGCPACQPDCWCEMKLLNGTRCNKPGRKWPQAPGGTYCYEHMLLMSGRLAVESLRGGDGHGR